MGHFYHRTFGLNISTSELNLQLSVSILNKFVWHFQDQQH